MKRRNGGMKNAAKCCASTAAKLVSEGAVEVLKNTAQDELRNRGPLQKIEYQSNMIRNRSPKSFENFTFMKENVPNYNVKHPIYLPPPSPQPHPNLFQHF